MATLKGFPPSNTISPSVRFIEQDLTMGGESDVLAAQAIGLVGFCSKGPINKPTRVSSFGELTTKFGNPNIRNKNGEATSYAPYLIWAAQLALGISNNVYIVRCAETDPVSQDYAMTASTDVLAAGGVVKIIGSGKFDLTTKLTFNTDRWFCWKLNGVKSDKVLMIPKTPLSGTYSTGMTIEEIAAYLNNQIDADVDGITFTVVENPPKYSLQVSTTWAFGVNASIELCSIMDNLVGGTVGTGTAYTSTNGNLLGMGTSMTRGTVAGTISKYPNNGYTSAGVYNFTGATNLWFQVVVSGTGKRYDGVVQTYDLTTVLTSGAQPKTATDIVNAINTKINTNDFNAGLIFGGFFPQVNGNTVDLHTYAYGRDAKILVRPSSEFAKVMGWTTYTISGGPTTNFTCTSGTGNCSDKPVVLGSSNTTNAVSFTVTADSPGIEGNNTFVVVKNDSYGNTFSIKVYTQNPFTKQIANVESWGKLTKSKASQYYVETYLNARSDYIRIDDNTDVPSPPADTVTTDEPNFLSGGTDGVPAPLLTDPTDTAYLTRRNDLLIGNPLGLSGLYAFSEPDQTNIDTIAVPGAVDDDVILALIDMCENYRQDCLAVIDPPSGMNPEEVVQWQNGQSDTNSVRFNSDYAALYWPWVIMRDNYNALDVTVPPSGAVLAAIARNDVVGFPWLAPAGLTRGIVPGIIGVASEPTLTERDLMYGNANAINPIVRYTGVDNFLIWGQKTLQRTPSALDRINVRRMMFYIEKQIKVLSRSILFEPHTESTRAKFIELASSVLENVKVNNGLYAYKIICDANLNTADVIDRNELRAQIGVQPTRSIEFIYIEFSLFRTGSFNESTAVAT